MKKFLLLPFLFVATNSLADELHNFDQIKSAVTSGKLIRVATDFTKCSASKKDAAQFKFSIGIFTPNEIIINNAGNVAGSLLHFTLNDPNFLSKPIYQFVGYTITSDNNVNLTAQILDARNYAPLTEKFTFNCKIDTGAKIYI